MSRSTWIEALTLAVAASVGVLAAVATGLEPALRLVLVLPLIVFVPGYALVRAAAPATRISPLPRFVLGLGASIAITALAGVVLDTMPGGLSAGSWAAVLFLVAIVSTMVLLLRSRHVAVAESASAGPAAGETTIPPDRRRLALNSFLFATSLVIVVVAFGVAIAAFDNQPRPGFTQLWMLPTADPSTVTLGILNEEGQSVDFSLSLTRSGQVEADWPSITLADGQSWQASATVPDFQQANEPLEASLTRLDSPGTVYRHVELYPSAGPAGQN
jgi:uncharacterized membrane protein